VAVELLAPPRLLFLGEPAARPDPSTDRRLMKVLPELARGGPPGICPTPVMGGGDLFARGVVVGGGAVGGSGRRPRLRRPSAVAARGRGCGGIAGWRTTRVCTKSGRAGGARRRGRGRPRPGRRGRRRGRHARGWSARRRH